MRNNKIHSIIIHGNVNTKSVLDQISEFHANIIERNLAKSNLSNEQKIVVIDKILDSLKSRESNGIIE